MKLVGALDMLTWMCVGECMRYARQGNAYVGFSHVPDVLYCHTKQDHLKTVIENETTTDWDTLIVRIKREFVRYPFEVGWNLSTENGRRPSTAGKSFY